MADDLTALLRREMCTARPDIRWQRLGREELPCDDCEGCRNAARLAEVVWRWATSATDPGDDLSGMVFRQEEARLEAVRERDAARKSEAEAVVLLETLWTRRGHRQGCPIVNDLGTTAVPRWACNCGWDDVERRVKAALAKREVATDAG